jgi:hypothetical protein
MLKVDEVFMFPIKKGSDIVCRGASYTFRTERNAEPEVRFR